MATQTTDSPGVETPPPTNSHRFFGWLRGINVPRQPGWLGGVCAGVADRLGIDPLIVRGIVVVIAILGGPAFLLYAAAWLLLPDTENRIHLERLVRGELDRAVVGVAALVVLALLPVAQGFWFFGASYWGQPSWPDAIGRAFWTILLIAAGVGAIIWLARRAKAGGGGPVVVPATTDARPDTIPQPQTASAAATADAAAATGIPRPTTDAPVLPPAPAAGAPAEELAAWKQQQQRWKQEHAAWREQQAASGREFRAQRAAESHARAVANAEIAREQRRLRQLTNPRVTDGFVAICIGVALLAGAIVALGVSQGDDLALRGYAWAIGLAAATVTIGLSLVVSGLWRRRNGFLGFVAVLLVTATALTALVPGDRTLVGFGQSVSLAHSGRYAQPVGTFSIFSAHAPQRGEERSIDLWQGSGNVDINVPYDMTVRIEATTRGRDLSYYRQKSPGSANMVQVEPKSTTTADGRHHYSFTVGSGAHPDAVVHLEQGAGSVLVQQNPPIEDQNDGDQPTEGQDQ
jgi:phage shock protein PspC (stress-responsive transcriptional regulator)